MAADRKHNRKQRGGAGHSRWPTRARTSTLDAKERADVYRAFQTVVGHPGRATPLDANTVLQLQRLVGNRQTRAYVSGHEQQQKKWKMHSSLKRAVPPSPLNGETRSAVDARPKLNAHSLSNVSVLQRNPEAAEKYIKDNELWKRLPLGLRLKMGLRKLIRGSSTKDRTIKFFKHANITPMDRLKLMVVYNKGLSPDKMLEEDLSILGSDFLRGFEDVLVLERHIHPKLRQRILKGLLVNPNIDRNHKLWLLKKANRSLPSEMELPYGGAEAQEVTTGTYSMIAAGNEAVRYVREKLPFGPANQLKWWYTADELNDLLKKSDVDFPQAFKKGMETEAKSFPYSRAEKIIRGKLRGDDGKKEVDIIQQWERHWTAYWAELRGGGTCGYHAGLAFEYLCRKAPDGVYISWIVSDIDHAYVILHADSRPENINPETDVAVDPWVALSRAVPVKHHSFSMREGLHPKIKDGSNVVTTMPKGFEPPYLDEFKQLAQEPETEPKAKVPLREKLKTYKKQVRKEYKVEEGSHEELEKLKKEFDLKYNKGELIYVDSSSKKKLKTVKIPILIYEHLESTRNKPRETKKILEAKWDIFSQWAATEKFHVYVDKHARKEDREKMIDDQIKTIHRALTFQEDPVTGEPISFPMPLPGESKSDHYKRAKAFQTAVREERKKLKEGQQLLD